MSSTELSQPVKLMHRVLATVLPARTRRTLALVSLYALLRDEEPSMTQLTALNNSLRLGKSVSGLQLPSRLPNEIWGHGTQLRQVRDLADRESMVLARFPSWLSYGKQLDIAADVKTLLQFIEARRVSVAMTQSAKEAVKIVSVM